MSFDEEIPLGLARSLGRLQVRVDELEEGGAKAASDAPVVTRLRRELDEAKNGETRALLLVAHERKAREAAEARAAGNSEQAGLLAGLKIGVADLEARLRGKDQALAELQRKLDAAEQRVRSLEQAQPAPCPVCTAIKLMVLGVPQRLPPASVGTVVPETAAVRKEPLGCYEVAPGTLRGVAQAIRDQLAKADRPLAVSEIAERVGLPVDKIATNIHHQLSNGTLIRVGERRTGTVGTGYRYWLKSRPLPEGMQS